VALLAILLVPALGLAEPQGVCPIVPVPKVYRDLQRTIAFQGPEAVAIVVGNQATEPERYAAGQFQTLVERRFKRRLPVVAEQAVAGSVRQVFLFGQRASNASSTRAVVDLPAATDPAMPMM